MDDGSGGFTPECGEYTRPRQEVGPTVLGAIAEGTVIGPVLHYKEVKIRETCEMEIEIPSPSIPERNSRVMLCRGMSRYVDEAYEEAPRTSLTVPRKVHYHNFWTYDQDAENREKLSRAQHLGLQFRQTKSNAIVVNDHEPSQSGEQSLLKRMPTPRLAPNIILESRWRIGQEQCCESASDACKDWRGTQASEQEKEMNIGTLEEKCSPSSLQQQANSESSDFVIDFRVEGVPDDILPKAQKCFEKNVGKWEKKLRIGSRAKFFREDLSKEDGDLTFNEKSRRTICETGNVELFELGKLQRPVSASVVQENTAETSDIPHSKEWREAARLHSDRQKTLFLEQRCRSKRQSPYGQRPKMCYGQIRNSVQGANDRT